MNDTALILTAFGTSTQARDTYAFFEKQVREHFPAYDIYWAYTSRTLRSKMASTGLFWQGPEKILHELSVKGYRRAVFQSLHVVPGKEFDKISEAAHHAGIPVAVGSPLLGSKKDCEQCIAALGADIGDPADCITIIVGHGTQHTRAQNRYEVFHESLSARYPRNVLLSMVEGEPSWHEALKHISRSGLKKIKFLPLMFVAGEHMLRDVMGHEDSWAAQLGGFTIEAHMQGLGCRKEIAKIYFQHLQDALNGV